jgi:probable rRNA maturation factor
MSRPAYEILITIDEPFTTCVAAERLAAIARNALQAEKLEDCELGIVITDDETVRSLNREYAGEDSATDVLSFSLREGEEFVSPEGAERLGEVIISLPTARRQADDAARPVDDEVAHLLVHGILHLLGYDHTGEGEGRVMRSREEQILAFIHDA